MLYQLSYASLLFICIEELLDLITQIVVRYPDGFGFLTDPLLILRAFVHVDHALS